MILAAAVRPMFLESGRDAPCAAQSDIQANIAEKSLLIVIWIHSSSLPRNFISAG